MINKKVKETTIILSAFYGLSKDFEKHLGDKNLNIKQITDNDNYMYERKILRILQKLEIALKFSKYEKKAEKYLNKCIDRINSKRTYTFSYAVLGYSLLAKYKEEWKNKRLTVAVNYDDLNDVYFKIEESLKKRTTNEENTNFLVESMQMADDLYREILK